MARIYSKKWAYWKAEIVGYFLNREEERFHKRHLFDVVDLSNGRKFRRMKIASHCDIRKNSMPKIGDIVVMKYCKHKDAIDDKIQDSRIKEIIKHDRT